MDITSAAKLNNGVEMPWLGLGTWKLAGKEAENAVMHALKAGYRHIDTASIYENEEAVGKAVKKSGISRKDIFLTTKLWNDDHKNVEKAFEASLRRLGTEYIDLYLMHWPVEKVRNETWRRMEKLLGTRCRAVGVSNFTIKHLEQLMQESEIVPAVNQVEFSAFLYEEELLKFCKSHKIQLEAYSPLTRGKKLDDLKLKAIAQKYGKTPAQILIHWVLQRGVVAIPKSSSEQRIEENADIFDFSLKESDMKALDSLSQGFRTCWDPSEIE